MRHLCTCDVARDAAGAGDVVNAGAPLVLLIHGVEADEVLLRVTGDLCRAVQRFF